MKSLCDKGKLSLIAIDEVHIFITNGKNFEQVQKPGIKLRVPPPDALAMYITLRERMLMSHY